jgi:hypothetical protein
VQEDPPVLCVVGLAFQVDHRAAGGRRQRVGEGFGFKAELVDVVVERGGRHREAHAAQFGDDAVGAVEGLRAQAPAQLRRFVDHRLEAQLHQFVGRHQPGDAGADNRHFGAMVVPGMLPRPAGCSIQSSKAKGSPGRKW